MLANGTVRNCSASAHSELFWALRGGGGGNFGVVVDMKLRLYAEARSEVREVCWHGDVAATQALPRYAQWLESEADASLGAPALLIRMDGKRGRVSLCVTLFAVGSVSLPEQLHSLVSHVGGTPNTSEVGCAGKVVTSFFEWESRCGASTTGVNGGNAYMTSGVLMPGALDGNVSGRLVGALSAAPGERTIVNIHDGGGAIRAGGQDGAFVHRGFNLIFQIKAIWEPSPAADAQNMQWATQLKRALTPSLSGAYVNYIDWQLEDWAKEYYGRNLPRLEAVKRSVDPERFFDFEQAIGRAPSASCDAASVVARMYAFQAGQNAMDAAGLALMYEPDGQNFIPVSSGAPTAAGTS